MKKVILFVFILISITSHSQQITPDIPKVENQKSIVVLKIDSVQCNESDLIQTRLTSFYKGSRYSQMFLIAGAFVAITGGLLYKPEANKVNPSFYYGGALSLIGGVIYLDSFKYLNFKKNRKKMKESFYY